MIFYNGPYRKAMLDHIIMYLSMTHKYIYHPLSTLKQGPTKLIWTMLTRYRQCTTGNRCQNVALSADREVMRTMQ